jgi:hypothetical protein
MPESLPVYYSRHPPPLPASPGPHPPPRYNHPQYLRSRQRPARCDILVFRAERRPQAWPGVPQRINFDSRGRLPGMAQSPNLNRRDFPVGRRSGHSRPSRPPTTWCNYGVIGTGGRGQYLLRHLNGIDGGRCVAVCDIYQPNMEAAIKTSRDKPKAYLDYREVLARTDVDAVVIAVPALPAFPRHARRLAGRQARLLRKEPRLQARGGPRLAGPGKESIPSRSCKSACSGATRSSTRPPSR